MSKIAVATKRFSGFMKRNAMYLLILLCIASVATVIALAVTGNFGSETIDLNPDDVVEKPIDNAPIDTDTKPVEKPDPTPSEPTVEPLTFGTPCNGSVMTDYSNTVLVWNSTLGQYSTHLGVDFTAEDGKVTAVADGKVSAVGYDALKGHYIIINHDENYQSRYYSLGDEITLQVGDTVEKGQVIGVMSTTMATENYLGNHLHLEMSKDGEDIDPLTVLTLAEK